MARAARDLLAHAGYRVRLVKLCGGSAAGLLGDNGFERPPPGSKSPKRPKQPRVSRVRFAIL
jgi:hypothetical protein